MTFNTSGKLHYSDVKGLHRCEADWWIETGFRGAFTLQGPHAVGGVLMHLAYMTDAGRLVVCPGYLWDGSSGPTVDGKADPVPSLVHDVLYEAMRARKLSMEMRPVADKLYRELLQERGMGAVRAWTRYLGLRLFGRGSASPRKGPEYPRRAAA